MSLTASVLITAAGGLPSIAQTAGSAVRDVDGCIDASLPANDDGSSDAVALPFSLSFFGDTYDSLWVNNNGNVTFDDRLATYTPFDLTSTDRVIIAPFFADVDTRGEGSGSVTYGSGLVDGRAAFCVNWTDVGYFSMHADKRNTFQMLLVDRSDTGAGNFDIEFNYDRIEWETGDASSGAEGRGGVPARMGYANGVARSFEQPGSATSGAFLDSSETALTANSRQSDQPGRYYFAVRNGVPTQPIVFVHGIDREGDSGGSSVWCRMTDAFRRWGWSGRLETVAYYEHDLLGRCRAEGADGFDVSIDGYGKADFPDTASSAHDVHHGGDGEHAGFLQHDNDTDIRHLAYHWAWYVYDRYTSEGVSVRAVGHSMGGLIVRYAIARVQSSDDDFPDRLFVEEVVTMGTPHGGTTLGSGCPTIDQCGQMRRGRGLIEWLAANANNPQATGGTEWTVMGSYHDLALHPDDTAVDDDMDAMHRVMYLKEMKIAHSDFYRSVSVERDADVRYADEADSWDRVFGTTKCSDSPWPVRWTYLTLSRDEPVDPCFQQSE